jgi:hypothetical protein
MLNILKIFNKPLNRVLKNKNGNNIDINVNNKNINDKNTYIFNNNIDKSYQEENIIYYPNNEWFISTYGYNKSYVKRLIINYMIINNLFKSYFNMSNNKIKFSFKRRRSNRNRFSANKIYISKPYIKDINTNILIIPHIYNKQKLSIQLYIKKLVKLTIKKKTLIGDNIKNILIHRNRVLYILKKSFFYFKKWKTVLLRKNGSLLKYVVSDVKKRQPKLNKTIYNRSSKRLFKLEKIFFNYVELINFNKFKFSNLSLNLRNLGLTSLLEKLCNKNINIKAVDLKSIHLNSDIFSSAIALKLRDRKNSAVKILRKAIIRMVKIPDLHTLITFDDRKETMTKNNILNVIKQQVVTGVRFEASGRLTRRLTAMRAVFKYKYIGTLKDIRSSYNNKSSKLLKGFSKSNLQYTNINSKTRNGTFSLKGWISSH